MEEKQRNEDDFEDDYSTASDESETADEPVDHVQTKFQQHLEEARLLEKTELKPKEGEELDKERIKKIRVDFVTARYGYWSKTTQHEKMNFLHFLAYNDSNNQRRPVWLMARAIVKLPELMGASDSTNRTPLTIAITVKNHDFLNAVRKRTGPTTKEKIRKALKSECERSVTESRSTCLHTAISLGPDATWIRAMIDLAPHEMFSMTDAQGCTPLHLAVEYDKWHAEQMDIVEMILNKDPDALKIKTSLAHGRYSAYQYHEKSREKAHKEMKPPPAPKGKKNARPDDGKPLTPAKNMNLPLSREQSRTRGPSVVAPAALAQAWIEISTPEVTLSDPRASDSFRAARPPSSGKRHEEVDSGPNEASNGVGMLLKIESLQRMTPQEVSQCLRLKNEPNKEFWFDLGPRLGAKITRRDFERRFKHLKFDDVLQYVAFPRIELDESSSGNTSDLYRGREDMKFFFGWLRKKSVRRILRVEVDDKDMPCHSDEAVEEALETFGVEVLDWKRQDLDPQSIKRVGKRLRKIHLYWSGSNPVLRSWSANDGLCQTDTLERIIMTQVKGLDSEARTTKNLDDFEKRLRESWKSEKKPVLIRPKISKGAVSPPKYKEKDHKAGSVQNIVSDTHRWMRCMEEFADHFRQIQEVRNKQTEQSFKPVTVALIDDGVDIWHPDLRGVNGENFPGKTFAQHHGRSDRMLSYWESATGHGTLMARLIHHVCPSAVIYVIKLQTVSTENSDKTQIEPASAIQAIEHATEIGAQIISMSWTVQAPGGEADKATFDEVIRKAHNEKILMFCSASDGGKFSDSTYPHASNPSCIFRVGAAKNTGKTSDFVSEDSLSFVLPGEEVLLPGGSSHVDVSSSNKFRNLVSHTGSSIATALAAGLAALVYECVRLRSIHAAKAGQETTEDAISKLMSIRSKANMERMLLGIGVNHQTGNKYLEVWRRFNDPVGKLKERGMPLEQLGVIADLAEDFMRSP